MALQAPLQFSDIDKALKDAGLTQIALCNRAKVDATTYSRWKNGEFEPRARTLRDLHTALTALIAKAGDDAA